MAEVCMRLRIIVLINIFNYYNNFQTHRFNDLADAAIDPRRFEQLAPFEDLSLRL
jgi:hypothetical protein